MPVFNVAEYLPAALDSVLGQSLSNIEILCIDDCSQDNSTDIIARYHKNDSRVRYYKMDQNSGAGPCRNRGIKESRGEFIAFLDSDDLYPSSYCLEKLYSAAKDNKAHVCGGNLVEFYDQDVRSAKDWGKASFQENRMYDYREYPYSIGYYRFIYQRKMIVKNNLFFPDLRRYQDPVWFVDVMLHIKRFYGIDYPVYAYRKSHQKINLTIDKINHVFKGMVLNVDKLKEEKMIAHYHREIKEMDYFFYRVIYDSFGKGIGHMRSLLQLLRMYAKDREELCFAPRHVYGFLRYGLTLIKLKILYHKNRLRLWAQKG